MFSRPTNLPLREFMQQNEDYYRRLVGDQQWAYERYLTAYGPINRLHTGIFTPPNNTLHPNHSETAQERPASPASGVISKDVS